MARWLLIAAAAAVPTGAELPPGLHGALQDIATNLSAKWNCSFSLAFRNADGSASAAAGIVDFGKGRKADVADEYAWGSVTKVLTGASILKLVSQGAFGLDDPVAPLVDPILAKMAKANPQQNFSSMADLWGATNVSNATVRQLLSMRSGVPDFDTATPCMGTKKGCVPKDSLRALLYEHPEHSYVPEELMKVDWVAHQWRECKLFPFGPIKVPFCYSSTNFMLLGLILAEQAGKGSWKDFDQSMHLPGYLQGRLQFATSGPPSSFTHVHGYDRTSYNMPVNRTNDHDNWNVDGVFSGWSASDIVASAQAIADLAWEVYGPPHSVAPEPLASQMKPADYAFYGLATHNLTHTTGHHGPLGLAYGHLGATYGYQSIVAYFPELKFTLAVATNIETDYQNQPANAICLSYNAAASMLLGRTFNCTFETGSYYFSGCTCKSADAQETSEIVV